ncbi:hypothetical protein [Devosia sp. Root635]|uniref:hypothetical protein n=1 Tax=Devosia sp. Root635 TaxID=1736575 RepID=UPI0006F79B67|nr:hypothetical protein [Devosia sp. Root635]KRA40191.1 hypothetical protein ASD80_12305 [Devosia sp. Root635]
MAISSDYPRPVTVNGYVCHNCDDVSKAKRNLDPSPPDAAASDAVSFGGTLGERRAPGAFVTPSVAPLLDRYA